MISVVNLTQQKMPKIPWRGIAEKILGKKYDLSVVLAGDSLMKKLNKTWRKKNKAASVLSFPLSKSQGEIFINLDQKMHHHLFLFIHALLHLKGFKHSAKMKEQENKFLKRYAKYLRRS